MTQQIKNCQWTSSRKKCAILWLLDGIKRSTYGKMIKMRKLRQQKFYLTTIRLVISMILCQLSFVKIKTITPSSILVVMMEQYLDGTWRPVLQNINFITMTKHVL